MRVLLKKLFVRWLKTIRNETEHSGPTAAIPGLFQGKTNIVCEVEKTTFKLQEKALKLFTDIGMRIRYMNPADHDKPEMWTPIFKQNKANVVETLEEYINNLNHFKELMKDDNFDAIFDEMKNTNRIKDIISPMGLGDASKKE